MRIETDPQGLHVIENYFVKNDSNPPMTQLSPRSYEIYLPPDARIEGSAAMAPGGMPVSSSPIPTGEKGYYAYIFPIRPGETRFQVSYHLPYNGSFNFTPKVSLPTQNVAVMLPESMKFTGGGAVGFQAINDGTTNAQTFLARNVAPSQVMAFTVSGTGSMPREQQSQSGNDANAAGPEAGQSSAANDTRPGGGLGNPIDTPDPLNKYKWWILSGLALVLAVAAAFLLRAKPEVASAPAVPAPVAASPAGQGDLLATLKEELFALETERLEGKLSESEYAEQKAALETVLRRALSRQTVLS